MTLVKCFLSGCTTLRNPEQGEEWGTYCSWSCQNQGAMQLQGQVTRLEWGQDSQSSDDAGPNSHRWKPVVPDSFDPKALQVEA